MPSTDTTTDSITGTRKLRLLCAAFLDTRATVVKPSDTLVLFFERALGGSPDPAPARTRAAARDLARALRGRAGGEGRGVSSPVLRTYSPEKTFSVP